MYLKITEELQMTRYDDLTTEEFISKLEEKGYEVVRNRETVTVIDEEGRELNLRGDFGQHYLIAVLVVGLQ